LLKVTVLIHIIAEHLIPSLAICLMYYPYSFHWVRLPSDDRLKEEGRKKGKKS